MSKAAERRAARLARKQARQDARSERQGERQKSRAHRVSARQKAKEAAYAAGIDPAAKWTNLAGKAIDVGAKFAGGGKGLFNRPDANQNPEPGSSQNLVLIAAALGAFMLLKK